LPQWPAPAAALPPGSFVNLPAWVWSQQARTITALLPVHQQKRFRFFTVMVDGTFVLPGQAIAAP
jgi:hypothetical protein